LIPGRQKPRRSSFHQLNKNKSKSTACIKLSVTDDGFMKPKAILP